MGFVGFIGSSDFLAVFIAGNAFTWDDWFRIETENSHLQEVIDMLFTTTFFIYFGLTIPWNSFVSGQLSIPSLLLLAFIVMTLRRVPVITLFFKLIPAIVTFREAIFAGWFGPIGVASLNYALYAKAYLVTRYNYSGWIVEKLYPITVWLVLCSVLLHGITVPIMKIGNAARRPVLTLTRTISTKTGKKSLRKLSFFEWLSCKGTPKDNDAIDENFDVVDIEDHQSPIVQ